MTSEQELQELAAAYFRQELGMHDPSKSNTIIDGECMECCRMVDIAANLQQKLDALEQMVADREIAIGALLERNKEKESTVEGLETELSARKEDSEVLKKVVEILRPWNDGFGRIYPSMNQLDELRECLKTRIDEPEQPIEESSHISVKVVHP